MTAKPSVQEIKAAAESAIAAGQAVAAAKAALEADPDNQALQDALTAAEGELQTADAAVAALSQNTTATQTPDKKLQKKIKKHTILTQELRQAGVLQGEDDDEDEDDEDDDNKPVTVGMLKQRELNAAKQSSLEMAQGLPTEEARQAVIAALSRIVPSGNAEQDFKAAVALANVDRNDKILAEHSRRTPGSPHPMGAGAPALPPKPQTEELTVDEKRFMRPPFNMTEAEIKAARGR